MSKENEIGKSQIGILRGGLHGFRQALVSGLSGYIISALLSLTIVAGLFFQLEPFKAIERFGVDVSLRLISSHQEPADDRSPPTKKSTSTSTRFVFFDIDESACRSLAGDIGCATRNPVGAEAVRAVLPTLFKSRASAIVIDSGLDLRHPSDEQTLLEIIALSRTHPEGPSILLPIELRSVNSNDDSTYIASNSQLSDPVWLEKSGLLQSKVRMVPAIISTDIETGDGRVRNVRRTLRIKAGGTTRVLPNLPYLLSLPGEGLSWTDIDCIYFAVCKPSAPLSARGISYKIPSADDVPARIMFTIPALSQIPAGACDDSAPDKLQQYYADLCKARASVQDRYIREPVSAYLSGSGLTYPSEQLTGTVVIVGSSLPSGNDRHLTPTDVMSGPEVVINGANTFERFSAMSTISGKPLSAGDAGQAFLKKAMDALPAAIIVTIAYFVINIARYVLQSGIKSQAAQRILRFCVSFSVLSIALYLSVNNEVEGMLRELTERRNDGMIIDTLTPIAALLLEKYAELVKSVISGVERVTHAVVEGISEALAKAGRGKSKPEVGE